MALKNLWIIILISVLAGCVQHGVKPSKSEVDNSRTFNADYDSVWSAIIASVAEANLNITTLEKESGLVAISNAGYGPDWAEEGTRGKTMGVPHKVTVRKANFNILATKRGPNRTKVTINTKFQMKVRTGNGSKAFPYRYTWQAAYSNGKLEALIFDEIEDRIKRNNSYNSEEE